MKKQPFKAVVEQSPETDDRRPRFLRNINDPEDIVDVHGYKTVTNGGRPNDFKWQPLACISPTPLLHWE